MNNKSTEEKNVKGHLKCSKFWKKNTQEFFALLLQIYYKSEV